MFTGCGLFDDNSQPAIELLTGETDQLIAVNSTRTVEFYITDADDDDTHTVSVSSKNTSIAIALVNDTNLATTGMVDLSIRGIAVGTTIVTASVTDDSGQDNATTELVFLVTVPEPQVIASTPSPVTELSLLLNESVVTLTLIGLTYEEYIRWGGVTVSGINGVSLTTRRISNTEVMAMLEFDGTDFDRDSMLNFTVGAEAIAGYNGPSFTMEIPVIADVINISGPWLWMAVPTDPNTGGGVSTEIDSLAEASNDRVIEADVAKNGVNEGDTIDRFQWTSGSIEKTQNACEEFCSFGFFGIGSGCINLCWLNNINDILNTLGFGTGGSNIKAHTAYTMITLVSPQNQTDARLFVKSGDAVKMWLNGKTIHRKAAITLGCRTVHVPAAFDPTVCTPDDPNRSLEEFSIPITLKAGENLLMVKVRQHGDYWGRQVRLFADFTTAIPRRQG